MNLALSRSALAVTIGIVLMGSLAACSASGSHPAVEPITFSVNKLQGKTVTIPLHSELNITTGSLSVTSYSGAVADPSVAEFIPGKKTSTLQLDPSIKPLKAGTTTATLKNTGGGIQNITFTIEVTK